MTEQLCPHCGNPTRPMTVGEKVANERIVLQPDGVIRIKGKHPEVELRNHFDSPKSTLESLRANYAAAIDDAILRGMKYAERIAERYRSRGWTVVV